MLHVNKSDFEWNQDSLFALKMCHSLKVITNHVGFRSKFAEQLVRIYGKIFVHRDFRISSFMPHWQQHCYIMGFCFFLSFHHLQNAQRLIRLCAQPNIIHKTPIVFVVNRKWHVTCYIIVTWLWHVKRWHVRHEWNVSFHEL